MSTNFVPGTLWERVTRRVLEAIASGALHSLPTTYEFIEQDGVRFVVRMLANIERKAQAHQQQKTRKRVEGVAFDPFLPYEEELYVADLGENHVCLLNKFNVFDQHLLIVTRAFEEQEALINEQDFAALARCMAEFDGLAFYNGGTVAGASQRHKHLQYVPLPLAAEGPAIPTEHLLTGSLQSNGLRHVASPFVYAIAPFAIAFDEPIAAAAQLHAQYLRLLACLGLDTTSPQQSAPYNLLATRRWMAIVPRSQERYATISVNALGFAGSLFVRNQAELELLHSVGPLTVLAQVGM